MPTFCGESMSRGQRGGSLLPYSQISRPAMLLHAKAYFLQHFLLKERNVFFVFVVDYILQQYLQNVFRYEKNYLQSITVSVLATMSALQIFSSDKYLVSYSPVTLHINTTILYIM
jgi:hypothetical protein